MFEKLEGSVRSAETVVLVVVVEEEVMMEWWFVERLE